MLTQLKIISSKMSKNHIDIRLNHERFLKTVCESKSVFALENEEGYATSSSNESEDEDGDAIGVICFWSEKVRAKSCITNAWSNYSIVEIPLNEFIENWCIGIDNDGLLIGTNFDQNMFGYEIEGYQLILELIVELEKSNTALMFMKFSSIQDLKSQITEALK